MPVLPMTLRGFSSEARLKGKVQKPMAHGVAVLGRYGPAGKQAWHSWKDDAWGGLGS